MTKSEAPEPSAGRPRLIQLLSDDHLARRAKKGDRRAFEAIYRRYHQDLYRFCLVMVGNPQDAQDALQNSMVKALRALPGEDRYIRLKPWLYRIARNEAVETIRRRRDSVAIEPERIPSTLEIAETAETRERLRRLIADLAELPERQRAALTMRELGGFGFEQIAEVFDSSPPVARQTVYEARLSLRQMEAGREMDCKKVIWELSEADGRVTRRRDIQAHLRACSECRAFRDAITKRRGELGALAPLPLIASAGVLKGILGAGGGASGGLAGTVGTGAAGKAVATSAIAKSAATVAAVAAIGVTAADRGNLIDTPLPGGNHEESQSTTTPESAARLEPGVGRAQPDLQPTREASKTAGYRQKQKRAEREIDLAPQIESSTTSGAVAEGDAPPPATAPANANDHGPPDGLPAASSHGQQTAAAHRGGAKSQAKGHSSPPPHSKATAPGGRQHTSPPGQIKPDNDQGKPFQPLDPPSNQDSPPGAGDHPSKEAR